MRQITRDAVEALRERRPFKRDNTRVRQVNHSDLWEMSLHGHTIALLYIDDSLEICDGGWQSRTTKERLNALPNVSITQKNFEWFLNGSHWDGSWTFIQ